MYLRIEDVWHMGGLAESKVVFSSLALTDGLEALTFPNSIDLMRVID